MSRRNAEGVVLARAVPHPDPDRAARGEHVTVFWCGPADPGQWVQQQRDAARFADDLLARHIHQLLTPPPTPPGQREHHMWTVAALHARNGGPRTDIITEPPASTRPADSPPPATDPDQDALFGDNR
jgi:hypothetical protein